MLTLGRFGVFAKILRNILVYLMITRKKNGKYNASARFFNPRELKS